VGCGRGRALVNLAKAFPEARFVGYDIFLPSILNAKELAKAEGIPEDRLRFEVLDLHADSIPSSSSSDGRYDIVFTFDVIHDSSDPLRYLKLLRTGVKDDGILVALDFKCFPDPQQVSCAPLDSIFVFPMSLTL
jgi:SAM-dependent methyltransferase